MSPNVARQLALQNSVPVPDERFGVDGLYQFGGFGDFLKCYDEVGAVVAKASDLAVLAESYLLKVAAEGTMYVEFMVSPDHSMDNGISYHSQLDAIASGVQRARESVGIEARLIVTAVRHRGPTTAAALARLVVANPNPLVVGFGLTGNEQMHDADAFSAAFSIARTGGLGLTAHAGEWRDAQTVLDAVMALDLDRVGHGISVGLNSGVLHALAERGTGFEVCLTSNVVLGAARSYAEHPVKQMIAAGCNVTFATDDPAFFGTTPLAEMNRASQDVGVSVEILLNSVIKGINMAFCSIELKASLQEKLSATALGIRA